MSVRFRFTQDERRYMLLLAESYRLIAQNLPPQMVSKVMRNFGKLEQMAWIEGMRQGVACAGISGVAKLGGNEHMESLKAFQLHAHVYGSSDTPLRDAELEWLQRLMADESHLSAAWLDSKPMRFAPTTVEEWAAEQDQQRPPGAVDAGSLSAVNDLADRTPFSDEAVRDAFDFLDEDDRDAFDGPVLLDGHSEAPAEMPDMLDRLRDSLRQIVTSDKELTTWTDMIMALHIATGTDAAFLDLQLSGPMGRTILDQVGLINLHPGGALNMSVLSAAEVQHRLAGAELPAAPPPGAGDEDGAEPDGGGTSPPDE